MIMTAITSAKGGSVASGEASTDESSDIVEGSEEIAGGDEDVRVVRPTEEEDPTLCGVKRERVVNSFEQRKLEALGKPAESEIIAVARQISQL